MGWTFTDPYRSAHYTTHRDAPRRPAGTAQRGRRPAYVPIAPVIVLIILMISSFPAGLALFPLVILGLVMVSLAGQGARRRRWEHPGLAPSPAWSPPPVRRGPSDAVELAPKPAVVTSAPSIPAGEWPGRNPAVRSPFERLAFWDAEPDDVRQDRPAPLTPPAWDPLGVAPFAWDLPDPPPLNPPRRRRRRRLGAAKLITATVLLASVSATAGTFAGWWPLDWAAAAASALAVIAIALLGVSIQERARR